ncbi:MAG: uroporphyrinogen decarboxylase family protein, partial [Thermoguttaceae bacterium]
PLMASITPRENLKILLSGGAPEWIPFSLDVGSQPGFSSPVARFFHHKTGSYEPAEHFGADVRCFSLSSEFGGDDPRALHAPLPVDASFDEWGNAHWAGGQEGTTDRMVPAAGRAKTVGDIERLPSPLVNRHPDASRLKAWHEAGYAVFGYAGSIYEWSWWLRGMEQFLMDLVSEPELAEAIVAKVADHTARLARASARLGIDVLCFYDDAGMQTGMQLSPALWRRFIKPAWQRVLDSVRAETPGARFFLHSCGRIDPIVPDIVELGFHLLHPLQPECMDFETCYRQFGDRIALAATVSSQRILPFGTPAEVRQEVRRLAKIVEGRRRAMLMPSNVIQPETPWENVVAFAEEACSLRGEGP